MATGKIHNYPTVTLLATATTPNTEYTFSEPLTNFTAIRFVTEVYNYVLNSVEVNTDFLLSQGRAIICMNDGVVRKAQIESIDATKMTTSSNEFRNIDHLYVFGIK